MQSEGWSSQRLYRPFVRASLIIAVVLGFSTGATILIMPVLGMDRNLTWVTHSQSHGVVQLFGWVGLFVMGFAYHVVPRFFNSPIRYPLPQKVSMWLVVLGLVLRFTGQSVYKTTFGDPLVLAGGILLFAGLLVFGWTLLEVVRRAPSRSGVSEMWAMSGIFWAVVAGALHLTVTLRMAIDSAPLADAGWNEALIYVATFGFVSSFIFAVSARAVRGFLLLKPMYERVNLVAVAGVQFGLVVLVVSRFAELTEGVASTGLILAALGVVLYVYSLRVLEPASGPVRRFAVGYERYNLLVRSAYGWLVVGCAMLIVTALDDAGVTDVMPAEVSLPVMHVFTLGFITTLLFGVASKMLPIFEGADIHHPRLMDIAYVFVTISVILRVVFGFSISAIGEQSLAVSGGVGFIGICLFAIVAFQTMTEAARASYAVRAAEFGQVRFDQARRPTSSPLNLK